MLGATLARLVLLQTVRLQRHFGRGRGRTEGPFLGRTFLVTQFGFHAPQFVLQPVDLLLLLQAALQIVQSDRVVGRQVLTALLPVLARLLHHLSPAL